MIGDDIGLITQRYCIHRCPICKPILPPKWLKIALKTKCMKSTSMSNKLIVVSKRRANPRTCYIIFSLKLVRYLIRPSSPPPTHVPNRKNHLKRRRRRRRHGHSWPLWHLGAKESRVNVRMNFNNSLLILNCNVIVCSPN